MTPFFSCVREVFGDFSIREVFFRGELGVLGVWDFCRGVGFAGFFG